MTGSATESLEQALQDSKSAFMEIQPQGGGPGGMGCPGPGAGGMPGGYPSFRGGYPQPSQIDMVGGFGGGHQVSGGQGLPARPSPLGYSFPMNPMTAPHSSYNPVGGGGPGSGGHHFISPYQTPTTGISPPGRDGEYYFIISYTTALIYVALTFSSIYGWVFMQVVIIILEN